MNKTLQLTLALQGVGAVVFLAWWILKPTGGDPAEPFLRLQETVRKYGPVRSLEALPKDLFDSASALCRREACIQARYGGNRGRWLTVTAAKQRDPCLTFVHTPCGKSAIRREMQRILGQVVNCQVAGKLARKDTVRLRVQCGAVQDFITVKKHIRGYWVLAGEDSYPGFLPRLHSAVVNRR